MHDEDLLDPQGSSCSILEERKKDSSGAFIAHLNINSLQNRFEELKLLNYLIT